MFTRSFSLFLRIILIGCMVLLVPQVQAQEDMARHQVIEGVSIYLGILPIQMAKNEADELKLPNKVYAEKHRYYVLIAMFDAQTGRRIVDAKLDAKVAALGGLNFEEKPLEPIHIEKLVSYGNYFYLADPDVYHIVVSIKMPSLDHPISAEFAYQRPPKD